MLLRPPLSHTRFGCGWRHFSLASHSSSSVFFLFWRIWFGLQFSRALRYMLCKVHCWAAHSIAILVFSLCCCWVGTLTWRTHTHACRLAVFFLFVICVVPTLSRAPHRFDTIFLSWNGGTICIAGPAREKCIVRTTRPKHHCYRCAAIAAPLPRRAVANLPPRIVVACTHSHHSYIY